MNSKSFFVVLMFVLFGVVVAGGALGDTDLTPDNGTTAPPGAGVNYTVFGDLTTGGDTASGIPTSGGAGSPCGSVYIVQSGDTLSKIARACGADIKDLVAYNTDIVDPNLIYPNQKINIVVAPVVEPAVVPTQAPVVVVPTAAVPTAIWPTAVVPTAGFPTAVPTQASQPAAVQTGGGLRAGGTVPVRVSGFAANSIVQIGIGRVGAQPAFVGEGTADADGVFAHPVAIPADARAGERWVVTLWNANDPKVKVLSPVFVIAE